MFFKNIRVQFFLVIVLSLAIEQPIGNLNLGLIDLKSFTVYGVFK